MLPLSIPKGGSKSKFVIFVNKNQFKSNELFYKVSLCKNFQRQSCSKTIPLFNGVYISTVNVTVEPNISPQSDPPLQQSWFRRISAPAVKAGEKVQLSKIGSRLSALQQAIDEVRTLPQLPQRVAQKANLSFKNKFPYISVTDEASDFKFVMQLKFAKFYHKIPPEEKSRWGFRLIFI